MRSPSQTLSLVVGIVLIAISIVGMLALVGHLGYGFLSSHRPFTARGWRSSLEFAAFSLVLFGGGFVTIGWWGWRRVVAGGRRRGPWG